MTGLKLWRAMCIVGLSSLAALTGCSSGGGGRDIPAAPAQVWRNPDISPESVAIGGTWAQWRGNDRDGRYHDGAWPSKLNGKLDKQLEIKIGPGYAAPIVASDRFFTFETFEKSVEVVRAFDRRTGEELWRTQWVGAVGVPFYAARAGSHVKSTPAYDGTHIYAAGMQDTLTCLNAANGDIVWRVDFREKFGTGVPTYGCVSSPMAHGGHVYIQAAKSLVKLDKRDGAVIWRAMEGSEAQASPVMATLAGEQQVVALSMNTLAGVDPDTGAVLWKDGVTSTFGQQSVTPTIYGDDKVFVAAHGKRAYMYQISRNGDAFEAKLLWDNRLASHVSSPVVGGDYLYYHPRNNRVNCVDANTGDIKWASWKDFGAYASLIINGDKLLVMGGDGDVFLIRATPEKFDPFDEIDLAGAHAWTHIVVADRQMFIRDDDKLTVYLWRD